MTRVPAFLIAATLALAPGAAHAKHATGEAHAVDSSQPGTWRIDSERGAARVDLHLERRWHDGSGSTSTWSSSSDVDRGDLRGVTASQWSAREATVSFAIVRESGTFRCEGRLHGGEGDGRFIFTPEPGFRAALDHAGIRDASDGELERMALQGVSIALVKSFEERRLHPTADDLIRLCTHGVTAQYLDGLRAAGQQDLDVDQVIQLAIHGVDPGYVHALRTGTRLDPTPDDLVKLKIHGVEAALAAEMAKGRRTVDADDLVKLQIHGVSASTVRGWREAGNADLDADELVKLQIHGVTPSWARRMQERHGLLTPDELVRRKIQGED